MSCLMPRASAFHTRRRAPLHRPPLPSAFLSLPPLPSQRRRPAGDDPPPVKQRPGLAIERALVAGAQCSSPAGHLSGCRRRCHTHSRAAGCGPAAAAYAPGQASPRREWPAAVRPPAGNFFLCCCRRSPSVRNYEPQSPLLCSLRAGKVEGWKIIKSFF